jgi:hypothetical protein
MLSGRHTSGPTKPLAQRHGRIESMRTSWQKPRAWTPGRDLARELPAEANASPLALGFRGLSPVARQRKTS